MKSDTPRTDLNCLTVETLRTMKGTGTKIVLAAVCRQLERELTEANAKIKELTFGWAADREGLKLGHDRYEKLRKLNPRGYSDLWNRALTGDKRFDELVDEL